MDARSRTGSDGGCNGQERLHGGTGRGSVVQVLARKNPRHSRVRLWLLGLQDGMNLNSSVFSLKTPKTAQP